MCCCCVFFFFWHRGLWSSSLWKWMCVWDAHNARVIWNYRQNPSFFRFFFIPDRILCNVFIQIKSQTSNMIVSFKRTRFIEMCACVDWLWVESPLSSTYSSFFPSFFLFRTRHFKNSDDATWLQTVWVFLSFVYAYTYILHTWNTSSHSRLPFLSIILMYFFCCFSPGVWYAYTVVFDIHLWKNNNNKKSSRIDAQ